MDFALLWQHPVTKGAVAGFVTAAAIDIAAFRKWQSFQEAREYSWGLAGWRWLQGTVYGALTALGMGVMS